MGISVKKKNPEDFPFVERGRETLGPLSLPAGWKMFFFTSPSFIFMVLLKVGEVWIVLNNLRRLVSAEALVTFEDFPLLLFYFLIKKVKPHFTLAYLLI